MGDPLAKVRAGQPLAIPAAAYNAFVESALAQSRHRHDQAVTREHFMAAAMGHRWTEYLLRLAEPAA